MAAICIAMILSGLFLGITDCTNAGYSTPPAPKVATSAGSYNVQIITYNPLNLTQNSLTAPMFTLPVSVQSSWRGCARQNTTFREWEAAPGEPKISKASTRELVRGS